LSVSASVHEEQFTNFMKTYNKTYASLHETLSRFEVFTSNYDMITSHNAKQLDWSLDINEFADQTWEEFSSTHLGLIPHPVSGPFVNLSGLVNVPSSIDWSSKGAVTAIKNQGQCGSCWAFSTTGSVEGAVEIKTGRLTSLSEQQLVDCSSAEGNQGCNGGLMDDAFKYIIKNVGLCAESEYPYKAAKGICKKSCSKVSTISKYADVTANDQTALEAAVALQPVSVAIEADQTGFQFYKKGVFSGTCGTSLDHGVLAVGYGALNGKDYWKVKNSWGASWGLNGYILIEKTSKSGAGQCGIAMQPSYPIA